MKYLNLTGLQYFWQKIKNYVNTRLDQLGQQIVNVYNFAKKNDITSSFPITIGANWSKSWGICKVLRQGDHYQLAIHMGFKCTTYTGYTVDHNPINITFPTEVINALSAAGFGNTLYSIGAFNGLRSAASYGEVLTYQLRKSGESNVFQLIASKQQCIFNVNDTMNVNVVFNFIA